ncbi:methyl-accepting chemotaxis protein [Janthinobacterium sp. J1-1]|uniref:methyl-accepting chemotaxis protein n=1 Tax=Janthinobacterium sp. J1-1 TaxID=3065910 RepID=UPI00281287BF|nr:methyl-accepting chemotaxis protein [Janthinobacterium sp. J1-1]
MKNFSIKNLIVSVIGLLAVVTIAIGLLGHYVAKRSVDMLEQTSLKYTQQQLTFASLIYRMETNRSQILQALQHNPSSKYAVMHDHPLDNHFKNIADNTKQLQKEREALLTSLVRQTTKDAVNHWLSESRDLGQALIADASRAIAANDWDRAQEILIRDINPTYLKGHKAYQQLQSDISQRNAQQNEALHAELDAVNRMVLGAIVLAVLLAGIATVYLVRAITRPLEAAVVVARRVAGGDLSVQVEVTSNNEFGQLLGALRDMTGSLTGIVREVRTESDVIATASSQIASGNMDLSLRTEQQASSIEETAASVEELTVTVRQNADNARQASELAATASQVALRGGAVVANVVVTMDDIKDSARKIVDIIAVIDSIAFQTNILALNAAVEAARAGEQGRGFAVVATEVRNLAHRSAGAAKEIKELITNSVGKVDNGSRLVHQAGTTMDEIVQSVKRVTGIMGEISIASAEQSSGIEQIHQAISQMDQATQQNAALVEEAASAAYSLQDSANSLATRVSIFKLDPVAVAPEMVPLRLRLASMSA